ncbi:hypothetical protein MUK42_05094 [Musa troglodytarum]|uniref:DUF7138 domain-containing protein n=1 Tax=Musa troglodytarum TaxID=320322 RepID=A0A9E7JG35_9LILI|nr:hypothetical protein MUK42_05094 [Musa troglodytarum]
MASELSGSGAAVAYFPVMYVDGDHEFEVGLVPVHPSLSFDTFQEAISQMIGVAPHRLSISLVRPKNTRALGETSRKVAIDEASDFAAIACERDCFVHAALRLSRRKRRGRSKRNNRDPGPEENAAPNITILRRNPAESEDLDMVTGFGLREHMAPAGILERQWQRFLLSTVAARPPCYRPAGFAPRRTPLLWCENCEAAKAEGRPPCFHRCVRDAVTFCFRSAAGPIQRPSTKQVEPSS